MGIVDSVSVDAPLERPDGSGSAGASAGRIPHAGLIVALFAAAIYLGCIISPPHLMDDVDAVQAQIARNMLQSGDYTTARLNDVAYLEKPPLIYWTMAASYRIFGVHDWAARLPLALAVIALAWLTFHVGSWAFGERAGFFTGLVMATCLGLWLFTRILIPDATLTLFITLALYSFLRALESNEVHVRRWAGLFAVSLGIGLLLKGLIAIVFPLAAAGLYLLFAKQLFVRETWKRLHVLSGIVITLLIAAPWHILATLRNPPYFSLSMHSGPTATGPLEYHGFFWFYFMNEHVLRFLNLRWPRDYNTVPRVWFWLFHFAWLFPWSIYFPAIVRQRWAAANGSGLDASSALARRGERVRLLALCWIGFVMVFFTLSTTQEYYSMPIYPAVALLLGSAIAREDSWISGGTRVLSVIAAAALLTIVFILAKVWNLPAPGDISNALVQHPEMYTLSLGHMGDLTLRSFAYLKLPLMIAGLACLIGAIGTWIGRDNIRRAAISAALMMVLFFHAARVAMVTFDPYLGSYPLAQALEKSPPGKLIEADAYYAFASVFFYTDRKALLLNGRVNNLEYGSYALDAKQVFIGDTELARLWTSAEREYLLVYGTDLPHIKDVVGADKVTTVKESGGNYLLTNQPL